MTAFSKDSFTITVKSNVPVEDYRSILYSLILLLQDRKEGDLTYNYWVLELIHTMLLDVGQLEKIVADDEK